MEGLTKQYKSLREAVEKAVSRKMCTPRDFDFMAMRIFDTTHSAFQATPP